MYLEDLGTVVARSCHQRGVDEKIGDARPIRDSANPEAEIGRPHTPIAGRQTCTCSHDGYQNLTEEPVNLSVLVPSVSVPSDSGTLQF